jgi:hypothetical protein
MAGLLGHNTCHVVDILYRQDLLGREEPQASQSYSRRNDSRTKLSVRFLFYRGVPAGTLQVSLHNMYCQRERR